MKLPTIIKILSVALGMPLLALLAVILIPYFRSSSLKSLEKLPENLVFSEDKNFEKSNILLENSTNIIKITKPTKLDYEDTWETRIYLPKSFPHRHDLRGHIFWERMVAENQELHRQQLWINSTKLPNRYFLAAINKEGGNLLTQAILDRDRWHHIAFVQSKNMQGLYVNGQLLVSSPIPTNTNLANATTSSSAGIGALNADRVPAFIVHMDSFRLSNVARYRGNKFEPPKGKMQPDEHTVLLYNFELEDYFQREGFIWVKDLSGGDRHGILGAGLSDSTPPLIVIPSHLKSLLSPDAKVSKNNRYLLLSTAMISCGVLVIGGSLMYLYKSKC